MSQHIVDIVQQVLARAPQWVRQDLASTDPSARTRAEESLAAMIGAALPDLSPVKPREEQDPSPG